MSSSRVSWSGLSVTGPAGQDQGIRALPRLDGAWAMSYFSLSPPEHTITEHATYKCHVVRTRTVSLRPSQIDVPGLEQPLELTIGKLAHGNAIIRRNQSMKGKVVRVRYVRHEGINALLAMAGQERLDIAGLLPTCG